MSKSACLTGIFLLVFCGFAAAQQSATLSVNEQNTIPTGNLIVYITGGQPGSDCLAVWSDNNGPIPFTPRNADIGKPFTTIGRGTAASDGSCRFELAAPPQFPYLYIQGATSTDGFETFALTNSVQVRIRGAFAADCSQLLSTDDVWGYGATGLDLRPWTGSELHWIGCTDFAGSCPPADFYCESDTFNETLKFGSSGTNFGSLRALIDPGDALGDTTPATVGSGCCSAINPNGVCNAFTTDRQETGISQIMALCDALGYKSGFILRESQANTCPEPSATATDGKSWSSDFVSSAGFGVEFKCVGFRD